MTRCFTLPKTSRSSICRTHQETPLRSPLRHRGSGPHGGNRPWPLPKIRLPAVLRREPVASPWRKHPRWIFPRSSGVLPMRSVGLSPSNRGTKASLRMGQSKVSEVSEVSEVSDGSELLEARIVARSLTDLISLSCIRRVAPGSCPAGPVWSARGPASWQPPGSIQPPKLPNPPLPPRPLFDVRRVLPESAEMCESYLRS
jgi:hypothetical protein